MKNASAPLIALLDSGVDFVMADLWTITLSGGSVVRWSGADKALPWSSQNFALGPLIERGAISEKRGLEVATLAMTITAGPNDAINGAELIPFIKNHGLDGAVVKLERAFMPTWEDAIVGTIIRFGGKVTSVDEIAGATARLTISSWAILLNVNMPGDLYQAACRNSVYDSGCALSSASFAMSGSLTGSPTKTTLPTTLSATNSDLALGRIVFNSGVNVGVSRTIRANTGGTLTLVRPLPAAPGAGDTFTAYPGCDRTSGRCSTRFNNLIHFRGEEFVPAPETAL